MAWILAWLLLCYVVLGYLFLMLCLDDLFPEGFYDEVEPQRAPIHVEPAPSSSSSPAELVREINMAAKAWGIDKKKR